MSDHVMQEIIANPNHVVFFKSQIAFWLERECMYASRTGGSDGYGAPIENELVKKHFGEKYCLTSKKWVSPSILFYRSFYMGLTASFINRMNKW